MNNSLSENQVLMKELQKQRKSQRRWLIAFAMVSVAALIIIISISLVFIDSDFILHLQEKNGSIERNYDYLQFVVPVLLAIGAFMAAALGINRLKNLDDQIEKIEVRLDRRFQDFEKRSQEAINTRILTQIEEKSKSYVKSLRDITEKSQSTIVDATKHSKAAIDTERTAAMGRIQQTADSYSRKMDNTMDLISQFNDEYSWLKKYNGTIDPDSLVVQSVADAHVMIEKMYKSDLSKDELAKQVDIVVHKVLNEGLTGDSADYHNLSAELARNELKDLSVKICNRGLEFFPEDEDLIADIIQYATLIGENKSGVSIQKYIDRLLRIDKKSWTWRCFEFLSDYYIAKREYELAKQVCDEYIFYLPRDERGYAQLAEIYGYMYVGIDAENEKIAILEKAVDMGFSCPRCANTLAKLYANRGELNKAIRFSSVSLLSLAQEQPSVNYAYVVYNRALYEDRLFLTKLLDDNKDNQLLKNALSDYKDAIESGKLSIITTNQAKVRYNLLSNYDTETPKYYPNNPTAADIISALSNLADSKDDECDDHDSDTMEVSLS